MKKVYKYTVVETGDFGGCGKDTDYYHFDNYEDAIAFYNKEVKKYPKWYGIEIEFIDGIAEAEKELAELKLKIAELEAALAVAKAEIMDF